MTQPKPTIEIIGIFDAIQKDWINPSEIWPGANWAYRVISPYNPDNEIIGVMGGTKDAATLKAKELAKKIMQDGKGLHPFARPIKFNRTGAL